MASSVQMKRKWALRSRGSLPKTLVLPGQVRQKPQGVHSLALLTHRDRPIGTFRIAKSAQDGHFVPDYLDLSTFVLITFELRMDSKTVCNPQTWGTGQAQSYSEPRHPVAS